VCDGTRVGLPIIGVMARYVTTIDSSLSPDEAFAYMSDFSHAEEWDPSVEVATRLGDVGPGAAFDLVVRFGGRKLPMRYETTAFDATQRRVVLQADNPRFTSRDTITVTPTAGGSNVHYDAALDLRRARLLDPVLQLLFNRTGDKAAAGMRTALNP
jgi:Polyketide cyclase / dehydrase and lipid transport